MHDHVLIGCRPVPLASYLKSLAVLRLVGEQADPGARSCWRVDTHVLRTVLDRDALMKFFLHEYRPTPIVAPWNRGSGFYSHKPKARRALESLKRATTSRLAGYVSVVHSVEQLLAELDLDAESLTSRKRILLDACRARLPDGVIPWLDAAFLLTSGDPKYPPLLGIGACDGNLDFSSNFMQRLLDVVDLATGGSTPSSAQLLAGALFDEPTSELTGGAIGQFLPVGAGGANAGVGFDGGSRFNPWDFVLMLEGAVTFAVAAVRRMERETKGALSYPFTARPAGVGYASATAADEGASRGEIWLPLWERPASAREIRALFSEGRARVSGRTARSGVDFARAVTTLGVDRGITSFERYGLQVRNGLSYLATPLERFRVREEPTVRLLDEIDRWLDAFRRRAVSSRAPASARRALGILEEAIVNLCRRGGPDRVQAVLVALGGCERTMARSLRWATDPKNRLTPVPPLSPKWLDQADDGSVELRLAAALASVVAIHGDGHVPLRGQMEPVATRVRKGRLKVEWDATCNRDVVFTDGDLAGALNAVLGRRLVLCAQWGATSYPDRAAQSTQLADVASFIEARTDDARLAALLWGAILIDWPRCGGPPFEPPRNGPAPPALYGLLKLCFPGAAAGDDAIPVVPRIHRLAAAGDGAEASRAATRRLRASGFSPAVELVHQRGVPVRRAAAAVLFPLAPPALAVLRSTVLRATTHPGETTP